MDLFINLERRGRGLARGIYDALREAILDGRLAPNDRLPPTRELSEHLGVSRHTITTAWARLTAEGFLEARVGAGTFVVSMKSFLSERRAPSANVLQAQIHPHFLFNAPKTISSLIYEDVQAADRSQIVNVESIKESRPWFHGEYRTVLKGGTEISWSCHYFNRKINILLRL